MTRGSVASHGDTTASRVMSPVKASPEPRGTEMSTTKSRRKSRVRSVVAAAAVTAGALALAPAAQANGGGSPQGPPVVALTDSGRLITVDTFGTHRVLADV